MKPNYNNSHESLISCYTQTAVVAGRLEEWRDYCTLCTVLGNMCFSWLICTYMGKQSKEKKEGENYNYVQLHKRGSERLHYPALNAFTCAAKLPGIKHFHLDRATFLRFESLDDTHDVGTMLRHTRFIWLDPKGKDVSPVCEPPSDTLHELDRGRKVKNKLTISFCFISHNCQHHEPKPISCENSKQAGNINETFVFCE